MKKIILSAAVMFALSASVGAMAQENKTTQKQEKAKKECCDKKAGDKKECCKKDGDKKECAKKECCSKKSECKDKKVEKK